MSHKQNEVWAENAEEIKAEGGYFEFRCVLCPVGNGYSFTPKWVEVKKPGEELWDLSLRAKCPRCQNTITSCRKMSVKEVDNYIEILAGEAS